MRKLFENRYFLIIWGVVVAAFNAVLFLSVATWKQEAFELAAFWGLYACVMLAFVSVLLICLLHKKNNYEQSILMTLVAPLATVAILVGIILFFCIDKIDLMFILIPYIIVFAFMIIAFAFGHMYQNHLDNIEVKVTKVVDINGLINFLSELQNTTNDSNIISVLDNLIAKASLSVLDPNNSELKALEKRIFEYALFIEKDIKNNAFNNFLMNAEKMEKLLDQRSKY
jgi:hypothetical protein